MLLRLVARGPRRPGAAVAAEAALRRLGEVEAEAEAEAAPRQRGQPPGGKQEQRPQMEEVAREPEVRQRPGRVQESQRRSEVRRPGEAVGVQAARQRREQGRRR